MNAVDGYGAVGGCIKGSALSYSTGSGAQASSASSEKGKISWTEKKGQDSSWSHGNCPVCF